MEIKNVIKQNQEYLCDTNITVQEWKDILQNKNFTKYINTLIQFYIEPNHKSTCKILGEKYNTPPQSFNVAIINFAKDVQKKLNRFKVIGTDGKPTYWIIPMQGKHVGKFFEWTIRPELVQAIQELNLDKTYMVENEKNSKIDSYITLLEKNKNLILTGAPGTGKSYLAKEIAKTINAETEFVQFHPSYDYTDFVEGLRPFKKENGELGFELKDGILKNFCRKALKNLTDSTKTTEEVTKEEIASKNLSEFLDDCIENNIELEISSGNKFTISEFNNIHIKINVPKNLIKDEVVIPFNELIYLLANEQNIDKVKTVRTFFNRTTNRQRDSYIFSLLKHKNLNKDLTSNTQATKIEEKKYVLIIDEINRAEISKVFGELFFSIDAGYRGENGKIKTQYANLQEEDDVFYDGFFIPENVYIIGTMNDIDRSVESFDFAMRRRFAWKEIKAIDRISMWDNQIDAWKEEARQKMTALNSAIENIQGLGTAFHIGPAYFLKLQYYNGDFEQLWENHLQGILVEYLRGFPENESQLQKLKTVYDNPQENVENNR